jgi:hypothetical protein
MSKDETKELKALIKTLEFCRKYDKQNGGSPWYFHEETAWGGGPNDRFKSMCNFAAKRTSEIILSCEQQSVEKNRFSLLSFFILFV